MLTNHQNRWNMQYYYELLKKSHQYWKKLWSRRFFKELMTLDGDIGARHLIAKHGEAVAEVPVEGHGAFLDIDTPQALGASILPPCAAINFFVSLLPEY